MNTTTVWHADFSSKVERSHCPAGRRNCRWNWAPPFPTMICIRYYETVS